MDRILMAKSSGEMARRAKGSRKAGFQLEETRLNIEPKVQIAPKSLELGT